ncbi:MAG: CynX/NimT family MFS transporter [Beutenbergiaceae bacterium]
MTTAARSATAAAAILLLAINLRTALATIPILAEPIARSFPFDSDSLALIGALPPIGFAAASAVLPAIARALSQPTTVLLALGLSAAGHVLRASATSSGMLIGATALALTGAGMGAAILPALIKRYFPRRIELLTATVGILFAFSVAGSTVLTQVTADRLGWRVALAIWAAAIAIAVAPWLMLGRDSDSRTPLRTLRTVRVWRKAYAWALAAYFGSGAAIVFGLLTWLPAILQQVAGTGRAQAAWSLALFALMGIPLNATILTLGRRARWRVRLLVVGATAFMIGLAGLLFAPQVTSVWIAFLGFGPVSMQMILVLCATWSASTAEATSVSGFVQGIGFIFGAMAAPAMELLAEVYDTWTVPLMMLLLLAVLPLLTTALLRDPRRSTT